MMIRMIQRMLNGPPFALKSSLLPPARKHSKAGRSPYAASFLSLAGELGVAVTSRNDG
jgi:hypothetical protein